MCYAHVYFIYLFYLFIYLIIPPCTSYAYEFFLNRFFLYRFLIRICLGEEAAREEGTDRGEKEDDGG